MGSPSMIILSLVMVQVCLPPKDDPLLHQLGITPFSFPYQILPVPGDRWDSQMSKRWGSQMPEGLIPSNTLGYPSCRNRSSQYIYTCANFAILFGMCVLVVRGHSHFRLFSKLDGVSLRQEWKCCWPLGNNFLL